MVNMATVFPQFESRDSLFQKMVSLGAPWPSDVGLSMDLSYFTMHSGLKIPSQYVKMNIGQNGVVNSTLIAKTLWDIYGKNWDRLWSAMLAEYNPIDNYNLKETIERGEKGERAISKQSSLESETNGTGSQITDASGTETLEHGHQINTNGTTSNFQYGFNSTEQVPTEVQTQNSQEVNSGTDTTTTKDDATVTTTSKDNRSDATSENTSDVNEVTENITRNRLGNVGQNSYQQLLTQEFELWKWNFFSVVFDDVDKFLCLAIWDRCATV